MALNEVQAEFVSLMVKEKHCLEETDCAATWSVEIGVPLYRHAVVQRSDHVSV